MELPDLGAPCSEAACRRLDFLPLKCDACERIFCADHVSYARHRCTSAYKKDVQVPVCPLCNTPVPARRGEMPDAAVGAHMDRDCRADPAQRPRKIFTNKCGQAGCRQREMMPVLCEQCRRNFCLKHRHPLDHDCAGAARAPVSRAGHAALARAQAAAASSKAAAASIRGASSRAPPSPAPPASGSGGRTAPAPRSTSPPAVALQNGLSEEEALQRALAMSLAEAAPGSAQAPSVQEDEDLALAQALSASEEEYRRQQQSQSRTSKPSNCSMS
ncbi:AN1-type zinc finger protein 2B isoform X2 [Alligator mississippiensis]|uniref:AN1-type zinc finger protein 2B isoform X2 n=1 Tax=Alligator mississippiensis TaxID=8496 RepID=UPI002877CC6F|nr:AN1-type zinc finger protein 2B isoform X2 [Alligator mississippiensis]